MGWRRTRRKNRPARQTYRLRYVLACDTHIDMKNATTPAANAFGQPIRPATAADKRRDAAYAPFSKPMPRPERPRVAVWVGK